LGLWFNLCPLLEVLRFEAQGDMNDTPDLPRLPRERSDDVGAGVKVDGVKIQALEKFVITFELPSSE